MSGRLYVLCLVAAVLAGLALTALLVRLQGGADDAALARAAVVSSAAMRAQLQGELQAAKVRIAELEAARDAQGELQAARVVACVADSTLWLPRADGACDLRDQPPASQAR